MPHQEAPAYATTSRTFNPAAAATIAIYSSPPLSWGSKPRFPQLNAGLMQPCLRRMTAGLLIAARYTLAAAITAIVAAAAAVAPSG